MDITLGQARELTAGFAGKTGKDPRSEGVRLFVMEVIQRLLHQGSHPSIRKWNFHLSGGCFTAPHSMEVPLKFKVNGYPERVWSKWYEFYDVNSADMRDSGFAAGIIEEINPYYTIYDLPTSGARVAVLPLQDEKKDAYVIVQGLDTEGRDVFTVWNGEHIHGEKLKISKEEPVYSRTTFSRITGIEKSLTCNYVRLYWQRVDVALQQVVDRGLLAEYSPTDTFPSYRRFRVPGVRCDCCVKVTILGRIRDIEYRHDNDIIPVTSLSALKRMAQLCQAETNEKLDVAQYNQQAIDKIVEDENQYHRTGGESFDFFFDNSPGAIENLQ